MTSKRYNLLRNWLIQTLADKPEIITANKKAENVYADLYEIWANDIQYCMKELLKEGGRL